MIPLLLMLAGADTAAKTPLEAERAFAADAKAIGQWTAFRKWSADDAVMFVPQPTNAHEFLKDRKDPAEAIDWWPTASYISCDGKTAVNTGGWRRPDGSVGFFSTVWKRRKGGDWKWYIDGGDETKVALDRPERPRVVRAPCRKNSFRPGPYEDPPPPPSGPAYSANRVISDDGTLAYMWRVDANGAREFTVMLAGSERPVIDDRIAAPAK